MTISDEAINQTIGEVYAMVGDPDGLSRVVRSVRTLLNGSSAMFFTPDRDPDCGGFGAVDHFNTELYLEYRARYFDGDPWGQALIRRGLVRDGTTLASERLLSWEELSEMAFFHEAMCPMEVARACLCIVDAGDESDSPRVDMSVYRPTGAPPFNDDEVRALRLLSPHLRQALRLRRQVEGLDARIGSSEAALEKLRCGLVLLDRENDIVFMNHRARDWCAPRYGLVTRRTASGHCELRACKRAENEAVQRSIGAAQCLGAGGDTAAVGPVCVHGDGLNFLIVSASAVGSRICYGHSAARVVVAIEAPFERRLIDPKMLDGFALTPAETRVAQALACGVRPKQIAAKLGCTENTVRTHIKALYRKSETSQLSGLVGILARLIDPLDNLEY